MQSGLIEDYYDIQHIRIEMENQVRAYKQSKAKMDEAILKKDYAKRMLAIEKDIAKDLKNSIKGIAIYEKWLKNISGIGPVLAAGLIAWIKDIKRFETISKLWAYSGLHVDEGGQAVRRKAGQKCNWNSRLKTHLWKVGESFVKTKGGYRELYDQFRKEYDEKWQTPEDCKSKGCTNKGNGKCMDGHRYAAAKRKTIKVFLAHYFMKSRELEGLPLEHPFIIGRNGHLHLIEVIEK
ncbi:MAG: transposase [Actinomycetota bacterium]